MQSATIPRKQARPRAVPIELSIVACGAARLTMPELTAIRKELPLINLSISPQLLRHSDEQSLAALVAVSKAMKCIAADNSDFGDWAIVCSTRNLGRSAFAAVIDKYRSEGPWGVSVQVIPHCTAHAVAGTISLALGSHGPCIGAGSGADSELDALVSTASILRLADWSGAWVVFTSWSPELAIDPAGRPTSDSTCLAVAIAVTRRPLLRSLGRISIEAQPQPMESPEGESSSITLTEFLMRADGAQRSWSSPASCPMRIHVDFTRRAEREYSDPS